MSRIRFKPVISLMVLLAVVAVGALAACGKSAPSEQIDIDGFTILLSQPRVDFPTQIEFPIAVQSDAAISRLSFQYQVGKLSALPVTSVVFPTFEATASIETAWKWDMRRTGGLPPGTTVTYWWSVSDANGSSAETPSKTLVFDDQRYSWKAKERGEIRLRWYEGNNGFADELLNAAEQATATLAEDVGAALVMPVDIYVYSSYDDLRGAMIFPQDWTGGAAYPEYGAIAIGIPLSGLEWGKRAISHEVAHMVVHQAIFSGHGVELPTWLSEGLAMYSEGSLSPDFSTRLQNAINNDQIYSVRTLSSPFPSDEESARLAYAESYSLVSFLLNEHGGRENMIQLLSAFHSGNGYAEALNSVYGLDLDQLNNQWRQYVGLSTT